MKTKQNIFSLLLLMLIISVSLTSCQVSGGGKPNQEQAVSARPPGTSFSTSMTAALPGEEEMDSLLRTLDEIAELERSGLWIQGLAITESGIREEAGDFAGAIAAAYKELSYAYGMGLIEKVDIENGLLNLLNSNSQEKVILAANTVLAFLREQWDEAALGLALLFDELDEPDCFGRWMMLVCNFEIFIRESDNTSSLNKLADTENRRTAAAYRSIRARYVPFPEYWYRGARAFRGAIAADYAENCINLSPQGPFALECRVILASFIGLRIEDSISIKTKREIESVITTAVNANNPLILDILLPLIGLPENPYTVYAVNALRSVISVGGFREYFNKQAASSSGRLAERLLYISRG